MPLLLCVVCSSSHGSFLSSERLTAWTTSPRLACPMPLVWGQPMREALERLRGEKGCGISSLLIACCFPDTNCVSLTTDPLSGFTLELQLFQEHDFFFSSLQLQGRSQLPSVPNLLMLHYLLYVPVNCPHDFELTLKSPAGP